KAIVIPGSLPTGKPGFKNKPENGGGDDIAVLPAVPAGDAWAGAHSCTRIDTTYVASSAGNATRRGAASYSAQGVCACERNVGHDIHKRGKERGVYPVRIV